MDKMEKTGDIKPLIYVIRGQKVMIDSDIAILYGVSTKYLNKQVKRNINRFPADFVFQLTDKEAEDLRFQFGTTNSRCLNGTLKGGNGKLRSQIVTTNSAMRRALPYAFTRNGVNMLAAVLRSQTAIDRSIFIMRAFSALEEAIGRKKNKILSSPAVVKELSVHSRAILRLFQEVKTNKKQVDGIERLQKEMARLLQKIIVASIE